MSIELTSLIIDNPQAKNRTVLFFAIQIYVQTQPQEVDKIFMSSVSSFSKRPRDENRVCEVSVLSRAYKLI